MAWALDRWVLEDMEDMDMRCSRLICCDLMV